MSVQIIVIFTPPAILPQPPHGARCSADGPGGFCTACRRDVTQPSAPNSEHHRCIPHHFLRLQNSGCSVKRQRLFVSACHVTPRVPHVPARRFHGRPPLNRPFSTLTAAHLLLQLSRAGFFRLFAARTSPLRSLRWLSSLQDLHDALVADHALARHHSRFCNTHKIANTSLPHPLRVAISSPSLPPSP